MRFSAANIFTYFITIGKTLEEGTDIEGDDETDYEDLIKDNGIPDITPDSVNYWDNYTGNFDTERYYKINFKANTTDEVSGLIPMLSKRHDENLLLDMRLTRANYIFKGWIEEDTNEKYSLDSSFSKNAETVFSAWWEPVSYKITFVENGGNEIDDLTGKYSQLVILPTAETVKRTGYNFVGWTATNDVDDEIFYFTIDRNQTDDITLYAKWAARTDTLYITRHYFENLDGTYIEDEDKAESLHGTTETTVSANILSETHLPTGFIFNEDYPEQLLTDTILADGSTVLKVYYKRKVFTVRWSIDGIIIETDAAVKYGEKANYESDAPTKAKTTQYSYLFNGWRNENTLYTGNNFPDITKNSTFTAEFTEILNQYKVVWNIDGQKHEVMYDYGSTPSYAQIPLKEKTAQYSYSFNGWKDGDDSYDNDSLPNVTEEVEYIAEFTEILNQYKVVWNIDGQKHEVMYDYGSTPSYAQIPLKEKTAQYSYSFNGWKDGDDSYANDSLPNVTEEVEYIAEFTETVNQYKVVWNIDGQKHEVMYDYGSTPSYTQIPLKEKTAQYSYSFNRWKDGDDSYDNDSLPNVTEEVEYIAEFTETVNQYKVVWNIDGQKTEKIYSYGAMPEFGGIPTKNGNAEYKFVFEKWMPTITAVAADIEYSAIFNKKMFKLDNYSDSESKVDVEIEIPEGIDDDVKLVVTKKEADEILFDLADEKEVINIYNAKLLKGNTEILPDGELLIKIKIPTQVVDRQNMIIIMEVDGQQQTKEVQIKDGYIIFRTNTLGDFALAADKEKDELIWLWIVLGVIGFAIIALILLLFVFRKKIIYYVNEDKKTEKKYFYGQKISEPELSENYAWYTDKNCTEEFTQEKMGMSNINVYGKNAD